MLGTFEVRRSDTKTFFRKRPNNLDTVMVKWKSHRAKTNRVKKYFTKKFLVTGRSHQNETNNAQTYDFFLYSLLGPLYKGR